MKRKNGLLALANYRTDLRGLVPTLMPRRGRPYKERRGDAFEFVSWKIDSRERAASTFLWFLKNQPVSPIAGPSIFLKKMSIYLFVDRSNESERGEKSAKWCCARCRGNEAILFIWFPSAETSPSDLGIGSELFSYFVDILQNGENEHSELGEKRWNSGFWGRQVLVDESHIFF